MKPWKLEASSNSLLPGFLLLRVLLWRYFNATFPAPVRHSTSAEGAALAEQWMGICEAHRRAQSPQWTRKALLQPPIQFPSALLLRYEVSFRGRPPDAE